MRNPPGNTFVPAAARPRRGGPPRWFWLPPPVENAAGGAYEWLGLELKPSAGRGLGVFATRALPAGMLLPYGGLEVSPARLRWLAKRDKDRFVARAGPAAGVDADPAHLPAGHAFACPGSRLNEASPDELYNSRFVWWICVESLWGMRQKFRGPGKRHCAASPSNLSACVEQPVSRGAESRARSSRGGASGHLGKLIEAKVLTRTVQRSPQAPHCAADAPPWPATLTIRGTGKTAWTTRPETAPKTTA
jgi:hypothetical protein